MVPCFTALLFNNQSSFSAKIARVRGTHPPRANKISENTLDLLYGKPLK
jgi:hypothetical protein